MQVTETHSAGLKREYKVVVGQAELNSELNAKLADMSKRANIKGFRPGKAPRPVLERALGPGAVLDDAIANVVHLSGRDNLASEHSS